MRRKKNPKLNWRSNFFAVLRWCVSDKRAAGKIIQPKGKKNSLENRKRNGTEIGIGTKWGAINSTLRLRSFIRLHNDNVQISWIQSSNWTYTQMPFRLLCAPCFGSLANGKVLYELNVSVTTVDIMLRASLIRIFVATYLPMSEEKNMSPITWTHRNGRCATMADGTLDFP